MTQHLGAPLLYARQVTNNTGVVTGIVGARRARPKALATLIRERLLACPWTWRRNAWEGRP